MRPPRPFQGAQYDKDMFTFLPTPANRDVLVESSRKRKMMASDHQITMAAQTMGYAFSGIVNPNPKDGDLRGKELQNFVPASTQSSTLREFSEDSHYGDRNDSITARHPNERGFYESRSEYAGHASLVGQSHATNHKASSSLVPIAVGPSDKTSKWAPSMTEPFNQRENSDKNAHVSREGIASQFSESGSYVQQKPVLMEVAASNSFEQAFKYLGDLQQNLHKPGPCARGFGENSYEGSYKVESSSNEQGSSNSASFPGVDSTILFGNNVGNSLYSLSETNNILQNALRLLSASSGIGLNANHDGNSPGRGDTNSLSQNLTLSSRDTTLSKNVEAGPNLDKPAINDERGSVNLDDEHKSENGASALTEKLWDGNLQLSSSVLVSAVAFFKSGEKMQDFSCSEYVEVKGKVRLEAFEKYVQDLPRSRSRGLMVMSLCWKEGSSDAGRKGMKEVARKYKEGKRVGFAQLSNGVDMYICPHSDTIITILAKHGFFKGMTAVKDKTDPLIGCVVWRKNSSSVPATKITEVNAQQPGQSLRCPSDSAVKQAPHGKYEKIQMATEVGENTGGEKSPEFSLSPCVDQPEQSMIPKDNPTSVEGTKRQLLEFQTSVEPLKPKLPLPPVTLEQSAVFSDDDDLPEYDFRAAVCQTPLGKSSETEEASSKCEMEQFNRSDSSTVSGPLPDLHFQGPTPQNIKHQYEAYTPRLQAQQPQQIGGCTTSSRQPESHIQGLPPQNFGHQPEMKNPNMPVQEQKQTENCTATMKPKNLFDDDDMPEWCPPNFTKTRQEDKRAGPSFASSHPMVPGSGFADLASGHLPPPPPPPPPRTPPPPPPMPLTQVQFSEKDYPSAPHLPKPAANNFRNESSAVNNNMHRGSSFASTNSMVPASGFEDLASGHRPPPPPPLTQGQFLGKRVPFYSSFQASRQ